MLLIGMTSTGFFIGHQLNHDPQLTLRPRGVDNVHISQCLHPVFMRLNIAVQNLVGFAVGAEINHVPKTRRIWIASWSTACPTTSGINSPFQLEWNGPFYSSQNVMVNIIMEWTLQFWLEWNGYNSSQSKLIQSCIHRIDHFFLSWVEWPILFQL